MTLTKKNKKGVGHVKYKEYNINKKIFGEDYLIYDWKEFAEENQIYVKSQCRAQKCPKCGEPSKSYHATYIRKLQIMPINIKTTYAYVTAYKYDCNNDNCKQKVFMEELPFAMPSQMRTSELNLLILAVSLFLSNEGASKVLGFIGIKVSNDAIKRIYDSIAIADEPEIETVGIDDVAIRKGQSYATAIYDINDRHLVALLKGRDAETLKEWLKKHRKIKIVTRDRASGYANAISEILPDCVQVADRFHLLANLIEKMRDIFRDELPDEVLIKDGNICVDPPEKIIALKVDPDSKQLNEYDYDNSIPTDENGNPINYDRGSHLESSQYKRQAESRKKNKN